ncbi:MAG TPA: hypothetical protein VNI82_00435 [Candidatus Nitrosotenuis sp.]|nr:hypothetical protein [Candidatus Nitrosotenuis sp.]
MKTAQQLSYTIWSLGALVTIIGLLAWSQRLGGEFTLYTFFPLLGILAFSLMWTHYISGTLRRISNQKMSALRTYFQVTSGIVLVLILLHPGLFYLQLFLDGLGVPPASYMQAYPDIAARTAILIGTLSLIVFLSFEFHRKFGSRSWWKYVDYANIAAMFGIFYHALTLGGDLMQGWFRIVWFLYGILLVGAIVFNHLHDRKNIANKVS